jgi:hypothetical protein
MFRTGIDSSALEKEFVPLETYVGENIIGESESIPKPIVVKALVGASITTQDSEFDKKYQTALKDIFQKYGIRQEKRIYKGAHLLKQISGKFDEVFTDIFNAMEPSIEHIDLYFATYPKEYVSIYGKAQGQRLTPFEYIEKHKHGFNQACAWWNWNIFSKKEIDHEYCIDYFKSKMTPGWTKMENSKANIKVFYSGCECNCLISFADLILKTIEDFHFGDIDYISIAQPIRKRSKTYALSRKIKCYNLSKYDWVIRETVPEIPHDINLNNYIKHPIYFIAWTPSLPRKTVKPSFEWSRLYNAIIQKALDTDGCVKFLDFDKDMTFWEDTDFIIPWEEADVEHVRLLKSMGFSKMPKVLDASTVTT